MPCFNGSAHIKTSVESALGQSFQNIELIVVDDGSTDESLNVLEKIRDHRFKVVAQSHAGVSAARNRGLAEAKGRFIAFLDADDTWHPQFLEKLYCVLETHPRAALAYCGWQNLGLPGGKGKPFVPPDYEQTNKIDVFLRGCRWPIHAALTRRDAIKESKGFDERFATSEDYLLWLRIATRYPIVRVPEVLAYYHFHEGAQTTRDRARAAFNHLLAQQEFLQDRPDVVTKLGRRRMLDLTYGELLKKGFICYWEQDLDAARRIFRHIMKTGYGTPRDWKYMLPALLPRSLHLALINIFSNSNKFDTLS